MEQANLKDRMSNLEAWQYSVFQVFSFYYVKLSSSQTGGVLNPVLKEVINIGCLREGYFSSEARGGR